MLPLNREDKLSRRGRRLTALIIDDVKPDTLLAPDSFYRTHFELETIHRWTEAQHRFRSGTATTGADLLLVDVGWLSDEGFSRVSKPHPDSAVLPIGPLLALPFIGLRPIMSCTVYSGHSKNKPMLRHTAFLVAMGLIAARAFGVPRAGYQSRHLCDSLGEQPGTLDEVIDEFEAKSLSSATGALEEGLLDYREDLATRVKDRVVTITNRTTLTRQLDDVIRRCHAGELVPANDSLYLGLAADGWSDRLSLPSLFADKLHWGDTVLSVTWAESVLQWLQELEGDAVSLAIELIEEQDRLEDETGAPTISRPLAHKLLETMFEHKLDPEEKGEVLRYVLLFANVYANEELDSPGWASVAERLGDKNALDRNTYLGWFGLRPEVKKPRGPFGSVLRVLARGEEPDSATMLKDGSEIAHADYLAIKIFRAAAGLPVAYAARYVVQPADGWNATVHSRACR